MKQLHGCERADEACEVRAEDKVWHKGNPRSASNRVLLPDQVEIHGDFPSAWYVCVILGR
jgi:hypothetical protein